ncbi:GNAT family N-acetyltransferase [Pseudomonas caricapapayae]|uniref:GNAT family N-acetyltransferase n=1 Tax=Pseudomonas caricapapayae TaxID=46678 RepID=A0ACC7LPW5_9PSED
MVGFISYKPRRPGTICASITYVVVRKDSRRCGVGRSMMAELFTQYPMLGLDCPSERTARKTRIIDH